MLDSEVREVMVEEFENAETLEELEAMRRYGHGYEDPSMDGPYEQAKARLAGSASRALEIARLEAELARLKGIPCTSPEEVQALGSGVRELDRGVHQLGASIFEKGEKNPRPLVRGQKRYRLLKTDVAWTSTPQIRAIMTILSAHVQVGDVVDYVDVVAMMEANKKVLDTRQSGKRIFDYYAGEHDRGLVAHGNLERVR